MLASLGKNPTDEYLEGMMNEAPGPINFTMFLTLFGERLQGEFKQLLCVPLCIYLLPPDVASVGRLVPNLCQIIEIEHVLRSNKMKECT